jgi:hypothetical protein
MTQLAWEASPAPQVVDTMNVSAPPSEILMPVIAALPKLVSVMPEAYRVVLTVVAGKWILLAESVPSGSWKGVMLLQPANKNVKTRDATGHFFMSRFPAEMKWNSELQII